MATNANNRRTNVAQFIIVNGNAVLPNLKFSSFEVHAKGCRDVVGLNRKNSSPEALESNPEYLCGGMWIEEAGTAAAAVEQTLEPGQEGGLADLGYTAKDFKVMPCCNLNRMRKAGRL